MKMIKIPNRLYLQKKNYTKHFGTKDEGGTKKELHMEGDTNTHRAWQYASKYDVGSDNALNSEIINMVYFPFKYASKIQLS